MSVYNDMAQDAGYSYGTDDNAQMAAMIEADHQRSFEEEEEMEAEWERLYSEDMSKGQPKQGRER